MKRAHKPLFTRRMEAPLSTQAFGAASRWHRGARRDRARGPVRPTRPRRSRWDVSGRQRHALPGQKHVHLRCTAIETDPLWICVGRCVATTRCVIRSTEGDLPARPALCGLVLSACAGSARWRGAFGAPASVNDAHRGRRLAPGSTQERETSTAATPRPGVDLKSQLQGPETRSTPSRAAAPPRCENAAGRGSPMQPSCPCHARGAHPVTHQGAPVNSSGNTSASASLFLVRCVILGPRSWPEEESGSCLIE